MYTDYCRTSTVQSDTHRYATSVLVPKLEVWCEGLQVDHKLLVGTSKVLQVTAGNLNKRTQVLYM